MGEKGPRFGQRKCCHRLNQSGVISLVLGKICDMAFQPVGQSAVCKTLTPPVYRHCVIVPSDKVGGNTCVFFDVFGAPGENYDCSLGGRGPPQSQSATPFVTGVYPKCLPVRLWRVGAQWFWGCKIGCWREVHQPKRPANCIAVPISPSTLRRPLIKADVASRSPFRIS